MVLFAAAARGEGEEKHSRAKQVRRPRHPWRPSQVGETTPSARGRATKCFLVSVVANNAETVGVITHVMVVLEPSCRA
jgi:hypothetical protein